MKPIPPTVEDAGPFAEPPPDWKKFETGILSQVCDKLAYISETQSTTSMTIFYSYLITMIERIERTLRSFRLF